MLVAKECNWVNKKYASEYKMKIDIHLSNFDISICQFRRYFSG